MSTLQIEYETSADAPNRLREVVSEELDGDITCPPLAAGPYDALTIAVIGPDDGLRNEMARALVANGGREIHAFSSYPPSLDDTPSLLMESHNLVVSGDYSAPEKKKFSLFG